MFVYNNHKINACPHLDQCEAALKISETLIGLISDPQKYEKCTAKAKKNLPPAVNFGMLAYFFEGFTLKI